MRGSSCSWKSYSHNSFEVFSRLIDFFKVKKLEVKCLRSRGKVKASASHMLLTLMICIYLEPSSTFSKYRDFFFFQLQIMNMDFSLNIFKKNSIKIHIEI